MKSFVPLATAKVLMILCLLLVFASGKAAGTAAASDGPRAMEFELRDQFGKTLAYKFPKEKVSVLTFGDRKGSAQVEGWVRPLYERFGDRIDLHGVAVLDSVPALFRGFARRKFRQNVKHSVLLDFDGKVTKAYGYEGDKANIFVIARDGAVVLKVTGAATPNSLTHVYRVIDRLLSSPRGFTSKLESSRGCNCRGGPLWPPLRRISRFFEFRTAAATEGRPYSCTLLRDMAHEPA